MFNADERDPSFPFGEAPQGLLIYSEEGWMSAAISRSDRPALPAGTPLRKQDTSVLASAFCSYFHYAGSYQVVGDKVFHQVMHALNPDLVGSVQERDIEFDDQGPDFQLHLRGVDEIGRKHHLVWKRA